MALPSGDAPVATMATDAAFAPAAPAGEQRRPLKNMSEVRHFFRTNDVPIYFVGATPFNLLGLDRWVRNFSYITYYDAWDGAHPRVFTPTYKPYVEFESGEQINNWLLTNAEVRAFIDSRAIPGQRPKVAMVFFDEETETICEELGYDLILPSAELRSHLDSKLVDHAPGQRGRRAERAERDGDGGGLRGADQGRAGRRARHRPRRADGVRRLRQDHVLHRLRGRLEEVTASSSWATRSR